MTNKRQIKKYIDRLGSDVAQYVLPAAVYAKAITETEAEEILTKISELKTQAVSRLNIAFDQKISSFPNTRLYSAARKQYYHAAYEKALADFKAGVQALIQPINDAFAQKKK